MIVLELIVYLKINFFAFNYIINLSQNLSFNYFYMNIFKYKFIYYQLILYKINFTKQIYSK